MAAPAARRSFRAGLRMVACISRRSRMARRISSRGRGGRGGQVVGNATGRPGVVDKACPGWNRGHSAAQTQARKSRPGQRKTQPQDDQRITGRGSSMQRGEQGGAPASQARTPARGGGSSATTLAGLASFHSVWRDTGGGSCEPRIAAGDKTRHTRQMQSARHAANAPAFAPASFLITPASGTHPELEMQNHPRPKTPKAMILEPRVVTRARSAALAPSPHCSPGRIAALMSGAGGNGMADSQHMFFQMLAVGTMPRAALPLRHLLPCLVTGRRGKVLAPRL